VNNAGVTQQELRLANKLDTEIREHYCYTYGAEPPASPVEHEAGGLLAA
jgi:hypothetical protein